MLTKEQIKERAKVRRTKTIPVPEWDGEVTIREFSAELHDRFDDAISKANNADDIPQGVRAQIVAFSIIDADTGELMFTAEDLPEINAFGGAGVERVFLAALKLNALDKESRQAALELAAKN